MDSTRAELRDRWPVILGATLCVMLTAGTFNAPFPFLYDQVIGEFGWSREQATLMVSWRFIIAAGVALVIGEVVQRVGARVTLISMALLGGAALLGFLVIDSLFAYYVCGMTLGVAGTGILVPVKVWMSQQFDFAQGTAIGFVQNGTTFIQVIAPFIIIGAFSAYGWRSGMALFSLGVWFVALPLIFVIFREPAPVTAQDESAISAQTLADPERSTAASDAGRGAFWLLAGGLFLGSIVLMGTLQNAVLFMKLDRGISIAVVAAAMSAYAVCASFGKVFFGWVYDKISIRGVMIVYVLLGGGALLAFPVAGALTALVFCTVRGLAAGGMTMNVAILAKHCFAPAELGRIIGKFSAVMYLGFAVGPWAMASIHDKTGSYDAAFTLFAVLALAAALLLLPVQPAYWKQRRRAMTDRVEA